ncbi:MAG: hypothetical protein QNJ98_07795 [Planctomycetota bacterium]|nr:hypothetical protein [Planctomycetota bacterium]
MVRRPKGAAGSRTLYLGVDEAGYGPLLGPLCVAASAFRAPQALSPDGFELDLRAALDGLVCATPVGRVRRDGPLPVPVDDSKRVKQRLGLVGLAQGVGAFAAAMGTPPPATLHDLVMRFSDRGPDELADAPWFERLEACEVPRYPWFGVLDDRFEERGITALDLRVLPVAAHELNAAFEETGNKARVLGTLSATLVLSILDRFPGEDAIVSMDRHGGRTHYGKYLAEHFPFSQVTRVEAPAGESRYVVELPDRVVRFRFLTSGDRRCVAVGWASMAAKLARELFMDRLNAWFLERKPALRPTAGYVTDGRRFLEDAEDVIRAERIRETLLIRQR